MKIIRVEVNQSLRDIAIAHYGTLEAVGELLALNEGLLRNDRAALVAIGVEYLTDIDFYVDVALELSSAITVDDQSKLVKQDITRELQHTEQTKYNG